MFYADGLGVFTAGFDQLVDAASQRQDKKQGIGGEAAPGDHRLQRHGNHRKDKKAERSLERGDQGIEPEIRDYPPDPCDTAKIKDGEQGGELHIGEHQRFCHQTGHQQQEGGNPAGDGAKGEHMNMAKSVLLQYIDDCMQQHGPCEQ